MSDKEERLEHANAMLVSISKYGRRFFHHDGRVTRLEFDKRGRVWCIDKYAGKRIYTHRTSMISRWKGFSDGGTLRALMEYARDYVIHGKPIRGSLFGPWPEWVCGGDLWGYGKAEMQLLRDELASNPAVEAAEV